MQNVFYKISYKDSNKNQLFHSIENIKEAIKVYNNLNQTSGISDVKFFIVNNIEEELTKEQLPTLE